MMAGDKKSTNRMIELDTLRQRIAELEVAESDSKSSEEKINRLKLINMAIRNVDQLIVKEKDRKKLLEGICNNFIHNRGYYNAWIFLFDEEYRLLDTAEAGLGEDFLPMVDLLKSGVLTRCAKTAIHQAEAVIVEDPVAVCTDCPLASKYHGRGAMISRLEYGGKVCGLISVSVPANLVPDTDEKSLFIEVCGDIAFALYHLELEEEHKQAEATLRASEERYRQLFENAYDAIWVHDTEGRISIANEAFTRLTGYSRDELQAVSAFQLIEEGCDNVVRDIVDLIIRKESLDRLPGVELTKKNGAKAYVQLSTNPIFHNDEVIAFQHIARDVTEERQMRQNQQYYLEQITLTQEEERKRIARELHDEIIQELIIINNQIDNIAAKARGLSEEERSQLDDLWERMQRNITTMRRLCHDLRPAILDNLGLATSLKWLASKMKGTPKITVEFFQHGTPRPLNPGLELALFRIAQEALNNVRKHSVANTSRIIVEFNDDNIKIDIEDNGKGFQMPTAFNDFVLEGKLGLVGMQERARLIGGDLKIFSVLGEGTKIQIEVPI